MKPVARVYMASKTCYAKMWKQLWKERPDIQFTSTWPFLIGEIDESKPNASRFWLKDIEEVLSADYVVVYAEEDDVLRGALIEAGAALGAGKTIFLVGENEGFGTWQHHPNIHRCATLSDAFETMRTWFSIEIGGPIPNFA